MLTSKKVNKRLEKYTTYEDENNCSSRKLWGSFHRFKQC